MYTQDGRIVFQSHDLHFLTKHGLSTAVALYQQHTACSSLPFIKDFHQLAATLGTRTGSLFSLWRTANRHYTVHHIPKANGGVRILHAPDDLMKAVQYQILHCILDKFPISPGATAYHSGSRITDNAIPHQNKRYLLKLDIVDFFGNITFEQVLATVFHRGNFPPAIGVALTALCCRNNTLPQGAVTSPSLSNLVMKHFDDTMLAFCTAHGLSYTRYCDDITISGNRPLFFAYQKAEALLNRMGFSVNQHKTHFISAANRQTVTGLTVNQGVGVGRQYKRALRQDVYYTLRYGAADHIRRCGLADFMDGNTPMAASYLRHLLGRIQYVLSVEPHNTAFQKAKQQIERVYALTE